MWQIAGAVAGELGVEHGKFGSRHREGHSRPWAGNREHGRHTRVVDGIESARQLRLHRKRSIEFVVEPDDRAVKRRREDADDRHGDHIDPDGRSHRPVISAEPASP